ncbi:hypothetical protein CYMTET_40880 [Cymbomonas tetramitiformis]|uniref:Uncharacterized protein n=1 Tax=Cymbomonas tetramitiformis TaxID=36881 RepID=A0AAE0C9C0_9CHLO|nr:hypothetical protein CYMTET_40880 [Cymbomonas tetramitiformis]
MQRIFVLLCCVAVANAASYTWGYGCSEWTADSPADCWYPAGIPGAHDTVIFSDYDVNVVNCSGPVCHRPASPTGVANSVSVAAGQANSVGLANDTDTTVDTYDGTHQVIRVGAIRIEKGCKVIITANTFLELAGPGESNILGELEVDSHGFKGEISSVGSINWFMFGGLYGKSNIHVYGKLTIRSGILAGSFPGCSDYYSESQTAVENGGVLSIGDFQGTQGASVGIFLNRLITNQQGGSINVNFASESAERYIHWGAFWGLSAGYCPVYSSGGRDTWGGMTINNYGTMQINQTVLKMHACATLNNHYSGILNITNSRIMDGQYDGGACDVGTRVTNLGVCNLIGYYNEINVYTYNVGWFGSSGSIRFTSEVTNHGQMTLSKSASAEAGDHVISFHGGLANAGVMSMKGGSLHSTNTIMNTGTMRAEAEAHKLTSPITNAGNLTLHSEGHLTLSGPVVNHGNLNVVSKSTACFEGSMANSGNITISEGDAMFHGPFSSHEGNLHVEKAAQLGLMSRYLSYWPGYIGPYGPFSEAKNTEVIFLPRSAFLHDEIDGGVFGCE